MSGDTPPKSFAEVLERQRRNATDWLGTRYGQVLKRLNRAPEREMRGPYACVDICAECEGRECVAVHEIKLAAERYSAATEATALHDMKPADEEIRQSFRNKPGFGRTTQMFSEHQVADIRATDREAFAKLAQAWALERYGTRAADDIAGLIRSRG